MVSVCLIALGQLRESYFRQAADEYKKRIRNITEIEIREERLPNDPSTAQIDAALEKEAERILAAIPKRSFIVAMCVEGRQISSEKFAAVLDNAALSGHSSVTFIIGSSHGLSEKVKSSAHMKLSMSEMTFPHKLARVMLLEAVYRASEISSGGKYHK